MNIQLLKTQQLDKMPFELEHVENLIWHDGPLLTHLCDPDKSDYFVMWIDDTQTHYRWLIWHLDPQTCSDYFNSKTSLLDSIRRSRDCYIVDTDGDNFDFVYKIQAKDIPDEYLPTKDSYI